MQPASASSPRTGEAALGDKGPTERHGDAQEPIKVSSGGVTFFADPIHEDYYLDVDPDHTPEAFALALVCATGMGLELMPEDECSPDVNEDGSIRHYFAEVIHC